MSDWQIEGTLHLLAQLAISFAATAFITIIIYNLSFKVHFPWTYNRATVLLVIQVASWCLISRMLRIDDGIVFMYTFGGWIGNVVGVIFIIATHPEFLEKRSA